MCLALFVAGAAQSLSELVAEIDSLWEDGEEVRLGCFLEGDCILVFGYSLAVQRLLTSVRLDAP